jgi:hypothetical protein
VKKLTVIAILAVVALAVLNILYEPPTCADAFYPLTNQQIIWEK